MEHLRIQQIIYAKILMGNAKHVMNHQNLNVFHVRMENSLKTILAIVFQHALINFILIQFQNNVKVVFQIVIVVMISTYAPNVLVAFTSIL